MLNYISSLSILDLELCNLYFLETQIRFQCLILFKLCSCNPKPLPHVFELSLLFNISSLLVVERLLTLQCHLQLSLQTLVAGLQLLLFIGLSLQMAKDT
jgi:hypothetical protein